MDMGQLLIDDEYHLSAFMTNIMYHVNRHRKGRSAMRVSREQFRQNRDRILEAAGRLFRERGFEQVGVADVMKAAGLTHGGFYGHFKSKDDLIAQMAGQASDTVLERWRAMGEAQGPAALKAIADSYLSLEHRDQPAGGCAVAALGPEISRQPQARSTVTEGVKDIVGVLQTLTPGASVDERRQRAIALYSSWIGAMVLARMTDDEAFSREVLAATARAAGFAEG
jgi:TetR/AcrR family transcriptional repressor of nem operon